jgi:Domain of unknown function (DUF4105)
MHWLIPALFFFVCARSHSLPLSLLDSLPDSLPDSWADTAMARAQAQKLASDPVWLNLGQYQKGLWGGFGSAVHSPGFFFDSVSGPRHPDLELAASIRALLQPLPDSTPAHASCRFPARRAWFIAQGLAPDSVWPLGECKSLNAWRQSGAMHGVSLVFATGYLKNPASYFGHVFLKFNSHPIATDQNLINRTVNFGADLRANDNPILYVIKGLTGLYDAVYTQNDFYTQRFQYGDNQLRDLWEFELNITPAQADTLAMRVFELFGQKYRYYFFNENCAYFIAKPLEDMLGMPLLPTLAPYSLPKQIIEALMSRKLPDGSPLVRSVQYQPSRQVVFYAKFIELDAQERLAFHQMIAHPDQPYAQPGYAKASERSRKKLLDVLIDYHDYIHAGQKDDSLAAARRQNLILERLQLPAIGSDDHRFREHKAKSPTDAPKSGLLSLGGHVSGDRFLGLLRIRPANHDFLSDNSGRAPFSELQVFDTEIAFDADLATRPFLSRFDLMNVQALNRSKTGLPGDGDMAWAVRMAYEAPGMQAPAHNALGGLFLTHALVGYGWSHAGQAVTPYFLAGGQAQVSVEEAPHFLGLARLGLIVNGQGRFAFSMLGCAELPLDRDRIVAYSASGEGRATLSKELELRIAGEYQERLAELALRSALHFHF